MGKTSIQWTDMTWNPVRGCTRKSPGCINCYAEVMAARFSKPGQWGNGFAEMKGGDHRWTGKVELVESMLTLPLKWRKPRKGGDGSNVTEWPDMDFDRIEHDPDGYAAEYQGAPVRLHLTAKKGDDMEEWPEDLRVREMPA